jgi:hypothetical protein
MIGLWVDSFRSREHLVPRYFIECFYCPVVALVWFAYYSGGVRMMFFHIPSFSVLTRWHSNVRKKIFLSLQYQLLFFFFFNVQISLNLGIWSPFSWFLCPFGAGDWTQGPTLHWTILPALVSFWDDCISLWGFLVQLCNIPCYSQSQAFPQGTVVDLIWKPCCGLKGL